MNNDAFEQGKYALRAAIASEKEGTSDSPAAGGKWRVTRTLLSVVIASPAPLCGVDALMRFPSDPKQPFIRDMIRAI